MYASVYSKLYYYIMVTYKNDRLQSVMSSNSTLTALVFGQPNQFNVELLTLVNSD